MDESATIRASQAGGVPKRDSSRLGSPDRQAFGTLVERYYRSVYRLAYHYAGNHQDADDVCQQTFLVALEKIGALRNQERFEGWLLVIASNLLRRQVRRALRRKRVFQNGGRAVGPEAAGSNVAASCETLEVKEQAQAVHRALQEMPDKMRLTAILVLMEERSQKDVAQILHCSEATVCRWVEAARNLLRANLRKLID